MNLWTIRILRGTHLSRCLGCKAVFDPDLQQGGNITVLVRRDPATGDPTRGSAFESAPSYGKF